MATKADRYEGIDGLKAYAIIGIALMHVLANGEYGIGGFVFERLIPSFTNLVFLFMMVSGFGMCCGYYQRIIDQKISVEDFYQMMADRAGTFPKTSMPSVQDYVDVFEKYVKDQRRGFLQETVHQNLAVFCTALCVRLCDFTKQGILV